MGLPVHNHTAGSFRKSSSKARRTEAKRARFFARQQALASVSPTGASRERFNDADLEENMRPPLDLVPIRAGDGSLEEDVSAHADAKMSSPPPGAARRATMPVGGTGHQTCSPPTEAETECPPSREGSARAASQTREALIAQAAPPQTPTRGGSTCAARRPREAPAALGAASDIITQRCYEQATDAWRNLNGALFEQMPYELNGNCEQQQQQQQQQSAYNSRTGVELGFLHEGGSPVCMHAGEGLLVEAEEPIELQDLEAGDEELSLADEHCHPSSSFHHVVVRETFHWRTVNASSFPMTPLQMPVLQADAARAQQWALARHEEQQWVHGYTPMRTPTAGGRRTLPAGRGGSRTPRVEHTFDEIDEEEEAQRMVRP